MAERGVESHRVIVGVLGPVTVDGRDIAGMRAKRLLVALVLADGRTLSTERLIDAVWGDDAPRSPAAALHTQVSRLRAVLEPARIDGADGRYRLAGTVTDLELVAQRLTAGEVAGAAQLWRGVPGDDLGGGAGADALADRARRLRIRVDEAVATDALARGEHAAAADIARERIDADPLDEAAYVLLMRALAGQGRRTEALAVFSRLRRTLIEQLGADPGAQASELGAQLLAEPQPSLPAPPRRLPIAGVGLRNAGNELIGRSADLAAIAELLTIRRAVTVQGPGGVGKTRIATQVGSALAESGRAVYFVPLASVRDGADLLVAVAGALGVGESELSNAGPRTSGVGLSERLQDALRGSSALLILDNCEQVIDACAVLVDAVLAAGPGVRVLTTSRSPLLIPAEQVYQLPVLAVDGDHPAAVELFRQRARAVRPDADLAADAVAELCGHLDGLPLAIELAAARVRTMSVEEISARLAERFELLRSADRTAPDRHRTLYSVIEWSWDLLGEAPRTLLTKLCLFPGGFSRAAAARVTGMSSVVLDDALTALADQSLLQVYDAEGQSRFRMLEMVREFGEQQLGSIDGDAEVRQAMEAWAADLCRALVPRYELTTDRSLVVDAEREIDNLVWALRAAMAPSDGVVHVDTVINVFPVIGAYWASRGLHPEVQSWGGRVLEALPTPPAGLDDATRRAWQATVVLAATHMLSAGALRSIARGRLLLRRLQDPAAIFDEPLELLSAMLLSPGTISFYRLVALAAHPRRTPRIRALGLAIRLNIKENFGDLRGASRDSARLAGLGVRPDSFVAAMSDMGTASVLSQQARWGEALPLYERSRARFDELGAADDLQQVGGYIVANRLQLGDYAGARAQLDVIRAGWRPGDLAPQGNPETVAVMMLVLGEYLRLAPSTEDTTDLGAAVDLVAVYRQAGEVLLAGHPMAARDPGAAMTVAAVAAGLVCVGEAALAGEFARAMVVPYAGQPVPPWVDIPQTGNLALVTGAVLCRARPAHPDGVALLVLAERLRARHDYPAMHQLMLARRELSGADDETWRAAVEVYGRMNRQRALAETQRILGSAEPAGRD